MKTLHLIPPASALTALVLCLTPFTQAHSQQGERPGLDRIADMLKQADTDNDGKISRDEFTKARNQESGTQFDRMDTNGDGYVDEPEITAIKERMRAFGRGGEGDRPTRREAPEGRGDADRPGPPPPEGGARPGFGGFGGAGGGPFSAEMFDKLDTDADGKLSKEEFEKAGSMLADRLRQGMQQRGGPGGRERERGPEMDRGEGAPGASGGFRRPPTQEGAGDPARPKSE